MGEFILKPRYLGVMERDTTLKVKKKHFEIKELIFFTQKNLDYNLSSQLCQAKNLTNTSLSIHLHVSSDEEL